MRLANKPKRKGARKKFKTYHARPRASQPVQEVHDRRAAEEDLPLNAHVDVVEIDDPYGELGKQQRIKAIQSLKEPLAWMKSHRRIDDASYLAGRRWQQIYARANIGSIGSIDTTKTAVSGGRFPDAITDSHVNAFRQLRNAENALCDNELGGTSEYPTLVYDVLGRELFPKQIAEEHGEYSDWAVRKWAKKFYRALNILAVHFQYASPKNG